MRRTRAGQTLVLGVLTMLLLALTTMAGFNLTHAVHERIRVQAAADAQAYSVAVMQARAFNTAAYANRTIAAILVAQTGLHAWLTIALNDVSMVHKGAAGMGLAALYEFTMARCSKFTPQHCIHAVEAGIIAARLRSRASQLEQKLWSSMSKFNDAARALKEAHRATYRQTKTYAQQVKGALASGSAPLSSMLRATAPRASYQSGIDQANVSSFACTLEGTDFDGECKKVDKLVFDRGALGASQRAKLMVDAANAARPRYEAEGKTSVPTGIGKDLAHDDFIGERVGPQAKNPKAVRSLMGRGEVVFTWTGTENFSSAVSDRDVSSEASSMFGPNLSSLTWRCAPHWFTAAGMGGAGGRVSDSGQASISGGGSRSANGFEGFACQGDDCFVNFRAMSGRDNDDGQPSTFGAVTQNLRDLQVSGRGTFELNANATSTVRVGSQQVKVQLAPRGNAVAVAKGKAYFHQLGASWAIRPNLFDPFWRAKLHPFRDGAELSAALSLAGARDPDVANDLPVEGKR